MVTLLNLCVMQMQKKSHNSSSSSFQRNTRSERIMLRLTNRSHLPRIPRQFPSNNTIPILIENNVPLLLNETTFRKAPIKGSKRIGIIGVIMVSQNDFDSLSDLGLVIEWDH